MSPLAFVCDAPTSLAEDGDAVTSEHPIARLGTYRDPRYGRFQITRKDYDGWVRNLAERQHGRIPIDYDHQAERSDGSTKAAGWITGLRLDRKDGAEYVVASIEWTPEGAEAVRNRYWLYVSPTFTQHYRDEQGKDIGPTLLGVALTNRPFLRQGMPAISLSEQLAGAELPAAEPEQQVIITTAGTGGNGGTLVATSGVGSGTGTVRLVFDSPAVTDLSKIAQALQLDADADEAKILTAVRELAKPDPADTKTLAEMAKAEGMIVLSATDHATLEADAKAGRDANTKLFLRDFHDAYDKALNEGRLDAKDETRAEWLELYEAVPETTLKRLAELPKAVNTTAQGAAGAPGDVPEGHDPDRYRLDQRARQIMGEKNCDYMTALDEAVAETERVTA